MNNASGSGATQNSSRQTTYTDRTDLTVVDASQRSSFTVLNHVLNVFQLGISERFVLLLVGMMLITVLAGAAIAGLWGLALVDRLNDRPCCTQQMPAQTIPTTMTVVIDSSAFAAAPVNVTITDTREAQPIVVNPTTIVSNTMILEDMALTSASELDPDGGKFESTMTWGNRPWANWLRLNGVHPPMVLLPLPSAGGKLRPIEAEPEEQISEPQSEWQPPCDGVMPLLLPDEPRYLPNAGRG